MDLDAKGFRVAGWAGLVVLLCALIYVGIQGTWQGVAVLSAFLIASAGFLAWRRRLPALFDFLFVLAAILNAGGWVFELWDRIPWFDPITHFYTTFAITLALGLVVYYSVRIHFRGRSALFVLSIAALGIALGALWEIVEWSFGVQQTYQSVAIDLIMDSLGAVLAGVLSAWTIRAQPAEQLRS